MRMETAVFEVETHTMRLSMPGFAEHQTILGKKGAGAAHRVVLHI